MSRMRWTGHGWIAEPEDVVEALGAVASAVWVKSPDQSLVFIEIDGRPLAGA